MIGVLRSLLRKPEDNRMGLATQDFESQSEQNLEESTEPLIDNKMQSNANELAKVFLNFLNSSW